MEDKKQFFEIYQKVKKEEMNIKTFKDTKKDFITNVMRPFSCILRLMIIVIIIVISSSIIRRSIIPN